MERRPFLDKAKPPTPAALARALGAAAPAYEALLRLVGGFRSEWNHAKTGGWMQKVHDGKKALCYVVPLEGGFRVSLTVRERERATLLEEAALASLHEALRQAPRAAEGHVLRFEVTDRATAASILRLLPRIIALRA